MAEGKAYIEIPKEEIVFLPFVAEAVQAFEDVCKKNYPNSAVRFYDCGNCDMLHVVGYEIGGVMLNVVAGAWTRGQKQ